MGWWLPVCSPSKWTLFHLFYLFHHQAPHWTGWTLLVTRRSYLSRGRHLWRPPIVFPATRNDKPRFTATSWLYVEQCHKTPIYPYEWMDYMVSTTHLYHFISIEMVIRWRRLIALPIKIMAPHCPLAKMHPVRQVALWVCSLVRPKWPGAGEFWGLRFRCFDVGLWTQELTLW